MGQPYPGDGVEELGAAAVLLLALVVLVATLVVVYAT